MTFLISDAPQTYVHNLYYESSAVVLTLVSLGKFLESRNMQKTKGAITALMRSSKECDGAEVVISHCENLEGAMKLKQQILADLPVKQVDIISCRGLTSFYAMKKGLILGY